MSKKIVITSITAAVVAGAAAAVLFVPHTITVKETMNGNLKGFEPKTTEVKTSLFDSMRNPVTVQARVIPHAELTGITNGNELVKNGKLGKVYKDETVSVDYKPTLYTASFKEGNVVTYSTNFQYGENPVLPKTPVNAGSHPYEDFKEWKKEEAQSDKKKAVETGKEDLSVAYDAVYVGKTYKIAYNLDGGQVTSPTTYQYGKGATLANASKSGYTFDGWYTDAAKTKKIASVDKNAHGDLTVYAKFHENPKPVVKQSSGNSYSGNSNRSYSGYSGNNGGASYSGGGTGGANFPYIGNAGAVTLSNGYSVALEYGGQAVIDQPYKAAFEAGRGTRLAMDAKGNYLDYNADAYDYIADHNYGTPAALPAVLNSNTMWLRRANGSVQVLHKTFTVRTNAMLSDSAGRDWNNGDYVHQYGRLMFQTCDESGSGRVLTIWN